MAASEKKIIDNPLMTIVPNFAYCLLPIAN